MTSKAIKCAVLAANGVDEKQMTAVQRLFAKERLNLRVVSTEKALIQTWNGKDWGHYFAVDQRVDEALSADYDALIIPGASRSIEKLRMNPHTKRFIEGFNAATKSIAAFDEAVSLLVMAEIVAGREIAVRDVDLEQAVKVGATPSASALQKSGHIFTAQIASEAQLDEAAHNVLNQILDNWSQKQAA